MESLLDKDVINYLNELWNTSYEIADWQKDVSCYLELTK